MGSKVVNGGTPYILVLLYISYLIWLKSNWVPLFGFLYPKTDIEVLTTHAEARGLGHSWSGMNT